MAEIKNTFAEKGGAGNGNAEGQCVTGRKTLRQNMQRSNLGSLHVLLHKLDHRPM
jgi:hypothetical protein